MSAKPLIVMALESEGQGQLETLGYEVLYCGVGKVNAAYHLTRRLMQDPVAWVLNLGSAGSHVFARGTLVSADRFVQHDMDVTGLGFVHGQTPFEETPVMLEVMQHYPHLPSGVCGSGDRFVQQRPPIHCDVFDMEAYALAKVCQREKLPFACVKYITDGADGGAAVEWQENLAMAAHAFSQLLKEHG